MPSEPERPVTPEPAAQEALVEAVARATYLAWAWTFGGFGGAPPPFEWIADQAAWREVAENILAAVATAGWTLHPPGATVAVLPAGWEEAARTAAWRTVAQEHDGGWGDTLLPNIIDLIRTWIVAPEEANP
jgi:hypothetical protein